MTDEYKALCPTCGGLPVDYSEMQQMRAALREALDAWGRSETEIIASTNSPALAAIEIKNSVDLARIAELRAKFLGGE